MRVTFFKPLILKSTQLSVYSEVHNLFKRCFVRGSLKAGAFKQPLTEKYAVKSIQNQDKKCIPLHDDHRLEAAAPFIVEVGEALRDFLPDVDDKLVLGGDSYMTSVNCLIFIFSSRPCQV